MLYYKTDEDQVRVFVAGTKTEAASWDPVSGLQVTSEFPTKTSARTVAASCAQIWLSLARHAQIARAGFRGRLTQEAKEILEGKQDPGEWIAGVLNILDPEEERLSSALLDAAGETPEMLSFIRPLSPEQLADGVLEILDNSHIPVKKAAISEFIQKYSKKPEEGRDERITAGLESLRKELFILSRVCERADKITDQIQNDHRRK